MNVLDQFRVDGKTALVTGARRGIGKAMAIALAEAGADIIGVSINMEATGSDIAKAVTSLDRRFWGYQCDFGDRRAVYAFVDRVNADGHQVDILINNAGAILRDPAAQYSDDYWDRTIEINLSSCFVLSREFGKLMLQRGSGKIIFIASLLTFQGGITVPGYAASKGGLGQLTKALANEWAGKGVQVNAIAPGYVRTDNTEALQNNPARSKAILERIPAGRWGDIDDFKGPAVFLASSASDFVNGEILVVDGGWMGR